MEVRRCRMAWGISKISSKAETLRHPKESGHCGKPRRRKEAAGPKEIVVVRVVTLRMHLAPS